MSKKNLVTRELHDEFKDATRIKGIKRVLVLSRSQELEPNSPTVFFGLEKLDASISYFCCSEDVIPSISREMMGLNIASAPSHKGDEISGVFIGPRKKIMHALMHIEQLKFILSIYSKRLLFDFVPLPDQPGFAKLALLEFCPEEVPLILGDAIHNLRSSLDLLVCEMAQLCGESHRNRNFPFAEDEDKFKCRVKKDFGRLGSDVESKLLALRAFKGGNKELKGLHDLDNFQKHELIIPIMQVAWGVFDMGAYIADKLAKDNPGKKIPRLVFAGDNRGGMQTLHENGEIVSLDAIKYFDADSDRTATALLGNDMPFARQHLLPTLETLATMTINIVKDFEQLFKK